MKHFVILKTADKQLQAELQKNDTPSEIAFKLSNDFSTPLDTPKYLYFRTDQNRGEYVFEASKLSGIHHKQIVTIEHLYQVSNIHMGKDKNILAQGNCVYEIDENGFSGYFPLPENICYMCVGAYPLGKIGGNHYHYRKIEYLYPIDGELNIKLQLVKDLSQTVEIQLKTGQILRLLPGVKHSVTPIGKTAKFIELSPNIFDKDDYPRE